MAKAQRCSASYLDNAIHLQPAEATYYVYRVSAYGAAGKYERAITDCNEALRLHPKFAPAFYERGLAYLKKKEYEKAIADLSEAVRLDPFDSNALHELEAARRAAKDAAKPKQTPIERTNFLKDVPAFQR